MILKNELSNIRTVLETIRPFVNNFTIVDTGSIDGTQEIARDVLKGISGNLFERPWEGYTKSRNKALELNNHTSSVFTLVLSADEFVKNGQALRDYLETQRDTNVDAFKIRLTIDDTFDNQIRVFRTGSPWHYEDADCGVHEFPSHPDPQAPIGFIPDVTIEHVVSDPEKRYASIWEIHIPLLEAALERNPDNERALNFLASSYETLAPMMPPGEALTATMKAMSLYMRRLALPAVNKAEHNYIKLHLLINARNTGLYNNNELMVRCNELCEEDPLRPEAQLLRLTIATRCLPVSQVYALAAKTIEVAEGINDIDQRFVDSPISTSTTWKAHLIAAKAAKVLTINGSKDYAVLVKSHVEKGLAAGGPDWQFGTVLEGLPPNEAALQ